MSLENSFCNIITVYFNRHIKLFKNEKISRETPNIIINFYKAAQNSPVNSFRLP